MNQLDGAPIASLTKFPINELADVDDATLLKIVDAIRIGDPWRSILPYVGLVPSFTSSVVDGPLLKGFVQTVCAALFCFYFAPPTRRRFQAVCETNGLAPHVIDALWRRRNWSMRFAPAPLSVERLAGRQGPALMGRRATTMVWRLAGGLAITFFALVGALLAAKQGSSFASVLLCGAGLGLVVATLGPVLALFSSPTDPALDAQTERMQRHVSHAESRAPMTPSAFSSANLLGAAEPVVLSRVPDMSADAAEVDADATVGATVGAASRR
jgi:hypothetical protein